jgi:hypothetical protein
VCMFGEKEVSVCDLGFAFNKSNDSSVVYTDSTSDDGDNGGGLLVSLVSPPASVMLVVCYLNSNARSSN